jgi:glycosyltransferase involved in cell wall biosynthesis
MKIILVNNYHYLRGGAEKIYFETGHLLEKQGHVVSYFSMADPQNVSLPDITEWPQHIAFDNIKKGYLQSLFLFLRFIYSRQAKKKMEEMIVKVQPDIIHYHIIYGRLTSSVLLAAKKYNVPSVMTIHDHRLLCPVYNIIIGQRGGCKQCYHGNYLHCIVNRCNKKRFSYSVLAALECAVRDCLFAYPRYIDKFIFPSKYLMNEHLSNRKSIAVKSVLLPHGIIVADCTSDVKRGDYILYSGRLSVEKGIMLLLEAWRDMPEINLRIAGDGELRDEIASFIQQHRLYNVRMLGFLERDALRAELEKAIYTIVPSICHETFSLATLESFASGKPVIAAQVGAIPELIEPGKTGFLFKPGDCSGLKKCVVNAVGISDADYRAMSLNVKKYALENYNQAQYYERLFTIYQQTISARE